MKHIAFPAISCGVYGYPLKDAASIAFDACRQHCGSLESITFILFSESTAMPFVDCAEMMFESEAETVGCKQES